jgi:hypothetical protein
VLALTTYAFVKFLGVDVVAIVVLMVTKPAL